MWKCILELITFLHNFQTATNHSPIFSDHSFLIQFLRVTIQHSSIFHSRLKMYFSRMFLRTDCWLPLNCLQRLLNCLSDSQDHRLSLVLSVVNYLRCCLASEGIVTFSVCVCVCVSAELRLHAALSPVYSDTTQLNSTRRRVELSCELSRFGHLYDVQLSWVELSWVESLWTPSTMHDADRRRALSGTQPVSSLFITLMGRYNTHSAAIVQ